MTDDQHHHLNVDFGASLECATALEQDKLSRRGFAEVAASVLRNVRSSAGVVLAIEGGWGSGKSSTLAMIEALLVQESQSTSPVIVHFNPWLIGEKDALLRQFLTRIASAVELSDQSRDAKKVAKEIKAYGKVFDLVKFIPGAEPWATIVKSVMEATGEAVNSVAEHKSLDVEGYKEKVEQALKAFGRPIVVFIDDTDRLFPSDVFEMIRIIKAVGGLPWVGYVVAWDASYVCDSLKNLGVPQAGAYLDKIVQVRMPLPNISLVARRRLLNDALGDLDEAVYQERFSNQGQRLNSLYHSGLRDLLDQPRDITRMLNAVRSMEPLLRGEVVFSDILGLAALSVKAPAVFELIKKKPTLFVGKLPDDISLADSSEALIKQGSEERRMAYALSGASDAAQKVVQFLFPAVAAAEDQVSLGSAEYIEGVISHPARLLVALQMSLTDGDVSFKAARAYLGCPELREKIVVSLTAENCVEFFETVGDVGASFRGQGISDVEEVCLSLARLVDQPLFVERSQQKQGLINHPVEQLALEKIRLLSDAGGGSGYSSVSAAIAKDPNSLSLAAQLLERNFCKDGSEYSYHIKLMDEEGEGALSTFARNVIAAAGNDSLFDRNQPGLILWVFARFIPDRGAELFDVLRKTDPSLDSFALEYLKAGWSFSKGDYYGLPQDDTPIAFCSSEELKAHASARLLDESLG